MVMGLLDGIVGNVLGSMLGGNRAEDPFVAETRRSAEICYYKLRYLLGKHRPKHEHFH
jgi:hypothetical protein